MIMTTYEDRARMTVSVPEGEVGGLKVVRFEVKPGDLQNRRDELHYGRGTKPGMYTKLVDANDLDDHGHPQMWMSDTDAEKSDHMEAVAVMQLEKARRILINGLGLGMVLSAALTYSHVKRVDVVESDERVIKLIGPHYLKDNRVQIHHMDAYAATKQWPRGSRWDVAWSDIWKDVRSENLPGMDFLHRYYQPRTKWHGMWGRKMCLRLRRDLRALGIPDDPPMEKL